MGRAPPWQRGLTRAAPLLLCVLAWEVLARAYGSAHSVMPPVSTILTEAFVQRESLLRGFFRTLSETVLGFVPGAVFGFVAGALFARVRFAERMFFPLFLVSQTVPAVAFGALVVIWFGNGIMSKVAIAFYLTFFPVTVNTLRGLRSVDAHKINLMRSFGASAWTLFWRLEVPHALPSVMASLLLGVSLSLVGAIVGEWFGDTVGLGIVLIQAMYAEDMVRLWGVVLACGLLGSMLYGLVAFAARRWVWWGGEI
jgi:NitT/TauT family transport system permease protein